ncbi:hypothetical protein Glove_313g34 [Diversispora epigaea]|uniref:Uncharacterized protein n=1 Tax=Diversispora epigaea TaxID=1348612 RepID=A0A397HUI0_9GLOM|nr:hypothetical protein Glove_313g34 [Diversispora epigaea]
MHWLFRWNKSTRARRKYKERPIGSFHIPRNGDLEASSVYLYKYLLEYLLSADNQSSSKIEAFKFNIIANEIIEISSNSSSLRKLCNINKEIRILSLTNMYLDSVDVEKGSCYKNGIGITIDETKDFKCRIKSVRAGKMVQAWIKMKKKCLNAAKGKIIRHSTK